MFEAINFQPLIWVILNFHMNYMSHKTILKRAKSKRYIDFEVKFCDFILSILQIKASKSFWIKLRCFELTFDMNCLGKFLFKIFFNFNFYFFREERMNMKVLRYG